MAMHSSVDSCTSALPDMPAAQDHQRLALPAFTCQQQQGTSITCIAAAAF